MKFRLPLVLEKNNNFKVKKRILVVLSYICGILFVFHFLRFFIFNGFDSVHLGQYDWDQHFFYLESSLKPIRDFGVLPFWNPYYVGGIGILENPQIKFLSPTFFLGFVFGTVIGIKLSVLFYYLVGIIGSIYFLHSVLKLHFIPSIFGGIIFNFSGYLTQKVYVGHSNFFSVFLYPFISAFIYRYLKKGNLKYLFLSSFSLSILIYEGNTHPLLFYVTIGCIILTVYLTVSLFKKVFLNSSTISNRKVFVLLFRVAQILFFFFLFSAYRLLPEFDQLFTSGSYFVRDASNIKWSDLIPIFISGSQHPLLSNAIENSQYRWWEYGNYIGFIPVILLLIALPFIRKNESYLLLGLLISILIMTGTFSFIFSKLPLYSKLRCWGRWSITSVFIMSILVAIFTNRIVTLIRLTQNIYKRAIVKMYLLCLLCVSFFVYYDLQIINAKNLKNVFPLPLNNYKSLPNDFKTVSSTPSYGAFSSQFPAILNNISVRDGYEILNSNRILSAHGEENYKGEYFLESNEAKVNPIRFSPGAIKFLIFLREDTVLHINGNYSNHWKATNGYTPYSENHLLSLKLYKGKNEFTLYYLSSFFVIGFILSLLGYLYFFIKMF